MIAHFILCLGFYCPSEESCEDVDDVEINNEVAAATLPPDVETFEMIFLSKMRRYGIKSATLTILNFERFHLQTKEAVKQQHLMARKDQLEEDNGKYATGERIISEDLELLYTSLQNPKRQHITRLNSEDFCGITERANIFSTKKLTEKEVTLLENRSREFLNTFRWYGSEGRPSYFEDDMKQIGTSSDPDSVFTRNLGNRVTKTLHVSLRSVQKEKELRMKISQI